jgi:hypothetical protein
MTDTLKPCPFCGGPVKLEEAHPTRDRMFGERRWWGVVCRNTTNLGGTCAIQQRPSASRGAAIERWNRRADRLDDASMADHARRYQWVRVHGCEYTIVVEDDGTIRYDMLPHRVLGPDPHLLDAGIDAAMDASKSGIFRADEKDKQP